MRLFSCLTFSLLTSAAVACPNLAGNFECHTKSGEYVGGFSMAQAEVAGHTQYKLTNSDGEAIYNADNVVRPTPENDTQQVKDSTLRAWCDADSAFAIEWLGNVYEGDLKIGQVTDVNRLSKIEDGAFALQMEERFVSSDGKESVEGDTFGCKLTPAN